MAEPSRRSLSVSLRIGGATTAKVSKPMKTRKRTFLKLLSLFSVVRGEKTSGRRLSRMGHRGLRKRIVEHNAKDLPEDVAERLKGESWSFVVKPLKKKEA